MKPFLFAFLFPILLAPIACRKHHLDSNGLPPATQQGKNTLGFLMNAQAWTPAGFNGTANLSLYYDETFSGGVFNIAAYKISGSSVNYTQKIVMFGDSIQGPQKILLPNKNKFGFTFFDGATSCYYSSADSSVKLLSGYFDIQKLDKANHIFSGQFEVSFKKTGCPDVQISEGRFDLKF